MSFPLTNFRPSWMNSSLPYVGEKVTYISIEKLRKEKKISRKKKKKLEEVDPSSESLDGEKRSPDVYNTKQGLGFFGYIFFL